MIKIYVQGAQQSADSFAKALTKEVKKTLNKMPNTTYQVSTCSDANGRLTVTITYFSIVDMISNINVESLVVPILKLQKEIKSISELGS